MKTLPQSLNSPHSISKQTQLSCSSLLHKHHTKNWYTSFHMCSDHNNIGIQYTCYWPSRRISCHDERRLWIASHPTSPQWAQRGALEHRNLIYSQMGPRSLTKERKQYVLVTEHRLFWMVGLKPYSRPIKVYQLFCQSLLAFHLLSVSLDLQPFYQCLKSFKTLIYKHVQVKQTELIPKW